MSTTALGAASGPVAAVAAGPNDTCALLKAGTVKCWGNNAAGALGNGTVTSSPVPVQVSGVTDAIAISVGGNATTTGYQHTCALIKDGSVRCWGLNHSGELGNGTTTTSPVAVTVTGITTAVAISANEFHTCAVLKDHTVQCWGDDVNGELGDGGPVPGTQSATPLPVVGVTTAAEVGTGYSHSCARLSTGSDNCWGSNVSGVLGVPTVQKTSTPVAVTGIDDAVQLAVGTNNACVLRAAGSVSCWGGNGGGSLGDPGLSTTYTTTPVTVSQLTDVATVSVGIDDSCALIKDGTVKCWGLNTFHQLGASSLPYSATPIAIAGLTGAVSISVGGGHACAVVRSGAVQCWGFNLHGELGDGTTTTSADRPVTVTGL